jgi:hypothetical protein
MEKWKNWFKAAGIRAIRTFFQTFASLMTVGAVLSEIDWGYVASASAVAGVYSLATSLAGLPEIKEEKDMNETKQKVEEGAE